MTSGKKIPPAVTLGMAIVNKGNNTITDSLIVFGVNLPEIENNIRACKPLHQRYDYHQKKETNHRECFVF